MKFETRNLQPLDANQRYTIDEAAAYLRISRVHVYSKVNSGELHILKDGRRSYIHGSEIIAASRLAACAA